MKSSWVPVHCGVSESFDAGLGLVVRSAGVKCTGGGHKQVQRAKEKLDACSADKTGQQVWLIFMPYKSSKPVVKVARSSRNPDKHAELPTKSAQEI